MRDVTHNGTMGNLFTVLQGVTIGAVVFLAAALVMAAISAKTDTFVVQDKVADAIRASQIQYPGKFDINDKRGIDTFSDCTVLQATILGHGALWSDMFDTLVYDAPRQHPCDVLVDSFTGHAAAPSRKLFSYSRYWLGSAVVARIALGMAGISIKNYRSLLLILSWLALITLALAFFFSYGRVSFIFLPFFVSLGLGYGFLTMGQSIAHAPEFIVGLLLLSAYCLANVQQLSLCRRAVFYSILGGVCVYFDVLDATLVLILILLCCQLIAPYAAHLLKANSDQTALSCAALAQEIVLNCSFVAIGSCIALALRIVGYSIVTHVNLLEAMTTWISNLSNRFSGSLAYELGESAQPSLRRLVAALKGVRQQPFHGFLGKRAANIFYLIGFAAWPIALSLCWQLHKKGVSPITVAVGFVMTAALVPAWFLVFEQHTIVHPWMTGRLVTPFCGLGMSLVVLAGYTLVWRVPRNSTEMR